MNITEVMRTGRKFRRGSDLETWFHIDQNNIRCKRKGVLLVERYSFTVEELTATNWEAEPLLLEITAQDLYDAARAVVANVPAVTNRRLSLMESAKLLADQLGLNS